MRLSNNYILNFRHITVAVCFIFGALNSAQAQTPNDNKIWATAGSDGTVDETDASKVFFDHSVVQMGRPLGGNLPVANPAETTDDAPIAQKPAVIPSPTESAVIRYNVTPVDGLFFPTRPGQAGSNCSGPQLELRYLAAGLNAQVVAKLIEVDLATGIETVRLTFNSKAFAAANGYQVHGASDCDPRWRFDFKRKAYYIEATLTRSSIVGGSAAGIQMINITSPADNDNDGIDDSLEQFLAEKYSPVIYIGPDESNYPVNVDWILQRAELQYNEDCGGIFSGDHVEPYLSPIGDQASLIGPPHTNGGRHCDEDNPQHRPISTIAADPQGEGPTGYSDQATFLLPDLNGIDRLGSLDPKDWVTYFHEYPTNDGGIMIQYWHVFAYNDFAGSFGDHGGDWDASIQVQLDSKLNLNGVWFSRHSDDHPGKFIPLSQITTYQETHPLMTIDGGGHASFASPLDWCEFNTGESHLGTVIWSDNPDPAPGASSPVLRKVDGCILSVAPVSIVPVFSDPVGGIVWKTWTDGMVKEYLPVTNPLLFETRNHGGLVNVGEYNPCTAITCQGSRQASSLLAGEFHPLNGQSFIRFEGRWGDLGNVNNGPRGPVFQGFDNGVYTAWYNQGSNSPATPQTPDDNKIWTTVGSDGTVDETDARKAFFDRSVVQMGRPLGGNLPVANPAETTDDAPIAQKPAAILSPTESAVIRYNVTPVDGLFVPTQPCQPGSSCPGIQLKLRYLAVGLKAQVVAKLIEVDLATGVETVRLIFNSNTFAAANGYQVQFAGECGPLWRFDFKRKAYYIEATLTHSSIVGTSAAGIQMIKIDNTICPG